MEAVRKYEVMLRDLEDRMEAVRKYEAMLRDLEDRITKKNAALGRALTCIAKLTPIPINERGELQSAYHAVADEADAVREFIREALEA